jgi:LPXTG-motif cell wall-anchored protein
MKRSILVLSVTALFFLGGLKVANAQEQPAPRKDTVNMDTDAKPQVYYAVEDENTESKGSFPIVPVIAGVVVIAAGAAFFLLKKKK